MNSKWLLVLLVVSFTLAAGGVAISAKQYLALRAVAETLPVMAPTSGPRIEEALQRAELTDEQKRWITQSVRSQHKEAKGMHELVMSFIDMWSNAARIQLFAWAALSCLLGIALFRAQRA